MAKRDPHKTAIKKRIDEITAKLKELSSSVISSTSDKIQGVQSLHGLIGHKNEYFINVRNDIIYSEEEYVTSWLQGLKDSIVALPQAYRNMDNSRYYIYKLIQHNQYFREYLYLFLQRTYLRNIDSYTKARPKIEESEIWIGQKNANYGILISPRFNGVNWENDKSEIRHFDEKYWSIGHILKTGLLVPYSNSKFEFARVQDYLNFFMNVIVRTSGSEYEYAIAERYSQFVRSHNNPNAIPLLIPEFRYKGIAMDHEHRLDFMIIQAEDLNKVGFELSPWSTHGRLKETKGKTQKLINEEASQNFEKEIAKLRKYFRKYNIYTLIYSDKSLRNLDQVFEEMKEYLEPKTSANKLRLHIYDEIINGDL